MDGYEGDDATIICLKGYQIARETLTLGLTTGCETTTISEEDDIVFDPNSWSISSKYKRTFTSETAASTYLSNLEKGMEDVKVYAELKNTESKDAEPQEYSSNDTVTLSAASSVAISMIAGTAVIAASLIF